MSERQNLPPDEQACAELPAALRAELASLRRDRAPPRELFAAIEARIADPAERAQIELPAETRQALAALRQDQTPARDLWSGIAPRIAAPHRASRRRAPWLAAAASLAASLLVVFGLLAGRDPALPASTTGKAPLRPSADVLAATLGQGQDAELQPANYRPISRETRALMRANLKIVETAETQIQRALADDPEDAAYLQSLLASASAQQRHLSAELAVAP